MRVSFIGLGNMGGHMSRRLAEADLDLTVYDVDQAKAAPALAAGARWAASAALAAATADVLITSLPTPAIIDDVMLGTGAALAALPPDALWVDMSTSVPAVAERVRAHGAECRLRVLDAPVSGMSKGAAAGTLEIFVGGAAADLEQVRPLLEIMGDPQRIIHVGSNGAGYAVKLMLNLLWFNSLVAIAEVLTIGVAADVDLAVLHRALIASPANSVLLDRDLLPLLQEGDYEQGFALALACKDLGLAVDLARSVGVPAEVSAVVEQIFRRARATFGDEAGEMSPVRLYEEIARTKLRLAKES
ncbi:MAG: NAD(P)-dependent oxidoreductase [Thermoleophilia bacterium]